MTVCASKFDWPECPDRLILGRLKIRLRIDCILKNDIQHYNLYFSLEIDSNITSIIDFISISTTPNGRISKSHITRWLHVTKTHVTNAGHVTARLSPERSQTYYHNKDYSRKILKILLIMSGGNGTIWYPLWSFNKKCPKVTLRIEKFSYSDCDYNL